uniref:zinc finger CCCH domain-containing protein 7A-like isoform X2 n=1 Tax=Myxine glutinosa TaxID=7769 RepID=UPI00358ED1D4
MAETARYPKGIGLHTDFLQQLVLKLFYEGNDLFHERNGHSSALESYTEALNLCAYMTDEGIVSEQVFCERLYINRAACFLEMGKFDEVIKDCDKVLEQNSQNHKALYSKARALAALGKKKEAYDVAAECSRLVPKDPLAVELVKELGQALGLRIRKAYVRTQALHPTSVNGLDNDVSKRTTEANGANGLCSEMSNNIDTDVKSCAGHSTDQPASGSIQSLDSFSHPPPAISFGVDGPAQLHPVVQKQAPIDPITIFPDPQMPEVKQLNINERCRNPDSESYIIGNELDVLIDGDTLEDRQKITEELPTSSPIASMPTFLQSPRVVPDMQPGLTLQSSVRVMPSFHSTITSTSHPVLFTTQCLTAATPSAFVPVLPSALLVPGSFSQQPPPITFAAAEGILPSATIPPKTIPPTGWPSVSRAVAPPLPSERTAQQGKPRMNTLDSFESDVHNGPSKPVQRAKSKERKVASSIDSLTPITPPGSRSSTPKLNCTTLSEGLGATGIRGGGNANGCARPIGGTRTEPSQCQPGVVSSRNAAILFQNPLHKTHEFRQACMECFVKSGPGPLEYKLKVEEDHQCRKDLLLGRLLSNEDPGWRKIRPRAMKGYTGQYVLCKEVVAGHTCRFEGNCSFAYSQEEIDVWTLERKGEFCRQTMFEPMDLSYSEQTVTSLLQENGGLFMFLCEVCFDANPRVISKRNKDDVTYCINPNDRHHFDEHRCLVYIAREPALNYTKIRPLRSKCLLDTCRFVMWSQCQNEDTCNFAHSQMELSIWKLQQETNISHEEIGAESRKHLQVQNPKYFIHQASKSIKLQLKLKMVCKHCWKSGEVIEQHKNPKYCNSKAQHSWNRDQCVVLAMSRERRNWKSIRPLPNTRTVPVFYEMCTRITGGQKCMFNANCNFAHSEEERKVWMYMKDMEILHLNDLFDFWKESEVESSHPVPPPPQPSAASDNGQRILMPTDLAEDTGYQCRLCGRTCNGERQWEQHIGSEKHKDRVFCDNNRTWAHRFPTGELTMCTRLKKGKCPDGKACRFAHSDKELAEWTERIDMLRSFLVDAYHDELIRPSDDFGKYNFLKKYLK